MCKNRKIGRTWNRTINEKSRITGKPGAKSKLWHKIEFAGDNLWAPPPCRTRRLYVQKQIILYKYINYKKFVDFDCFKNIVKSDVGTPLHPIYHVTAGNHYLY